VNSIPAGCDAHRPSLKKCALHSVLDAQFFTSPPALSCCQNNKMCPAR
jgi:hypothetical protein